MSTLPDATTLNPCGCCQAESLEPSLYNSPGQTALAYRIGTHSEFLRRMLARLPGWTIPDGDYAMQRPLARLTTRSSDDFAIALLDGWAVVGDVLTFYQERIANEGFLRSAIERRSVLELARAIGYELNPGVAASTYLVFSVDDAEQSPPTATIPAGTQVQSIPTENDQLPQTFETTDEFVAQVTWNELKPLATEPQELKRGDQDLFLKGVSTNLQPGDSVLLVGDHRDGSPGSERWDFRILKTVETFSEDDYTHVTWETELGHEIPTIEPADNPRVHAFRLRAALFGYNAPDWRTMPEEVRKIYIKQAIEAGGTYTEDDPDTWGYKWPDELFKLQNVADYQVDLDAAYPKVIVGSWVVLVKPTYVELYKVNEACEDSRTDFALTAKTTRLTFDTDENLALFGLRETVVYAESEELDRAGKPIESRVKDKTIRLEGRIEGLTRGHVIIVTGKEQADDEDTFSEVCVVESSTPVDLDEYSYTELELEEDLANEYDRSTVTIYANVVHATHGETVSDEVLGNGDGSQSHQTFQLNNSPLTYVSAATASGSLSTLSLRVESVEWQQVASLFGLDPDSRSYTVRIDNEAQASVIAGDGQSGARLPTGQENVVASYRYGIGTAAKVAAGSLSLLKTRPLGIRSVKNPAEASGAEDPEKLEDARSNAPVTVLTLERVVSLQDYGDFARSFTGIGKARADAVWVGEAEIVHVTIADTEGSQIEESADLFVNLFDAIGQRRDPLQEVRLGSFDSLLFDVNAAVLIDSAYEQETVYDEIQQALTEAFSFDQREFGQPVSAAEVVSVIHAVEGVVAVDLNSLALTDGGSAEDASLTTVLLAATARPNPDLAADSREILPAELLLINASGITLGEMLP